MDLTPNIKLVLDILQDEVDGDIHAARNKMHEGYSMTYMYKNHRGQLFPSFVKPTARTMKDIYEMKDRKYQIYNIAESNGNNNKATVFVEMVESYTDSESKKQYRTPIALVLEIKDQKIYTGRHYCDNDISYEFLNSEKMSEAYKGDTQVLYTIS